MSIESLLILALLLVFPLVERLNRHLREQAAQAEGDPADAPPRARVPARPRPPREERDADASGASGAAGLPATVPLPVLAQPAPPPLPARHPTFERLTAAERARAARLSQAGEDQPPLVGKAPPRTRRAGSLRAARIDLRRAVVLMTILGPCKALEGESGRH